MVEIKVHYDKLVRDRVQEIIIAAGKICDVSAPLSDSEFDKALRLKLIEESREIKEAASKDELVGEVADLWEVLDTFLDLHGISQSEIDHARHQKANRTGRYEMRVFLKYVVENEK